MKILEIIEEDIIEVLVDIAIEDGICASAGETKEVADHECCHQRI